MQSQVVLIPFEKWEIDFVGPIEPTSQGKSYILVCTDYITKWAEAKPIKHWRDVNVEKFLYESIFTWFGIPRKLTSDQGTQFTSNLIIVLMKEYTIRHGKSSPYHPQANGQVEVTNRELESILTKIMTLHRKDWATHLPEALWAYITTWKSIGSFTPFELFYGKSTVMPIEFEYKTLKTTLELRIELNSAQQDQIMSLNGLDEWRKSTLNNIELIQY